MKRILCMTVAAVLISSGAASAGGGNGDHPHASSGFYVGATAAYAHAEYSASSGSAFGQRDTSGGLFGVRAGYAFKAGSISISPEAEFLGSTLEDQDKVAVPKEEPEDNDEESLARNSGFNVGSDWLASVQLRAQTSLGAIRPYVVGGVAFQRLTYGADDVEGVSFSSDDTQTGWTLGAGVTLAADSGFTMDLGYQYYRFDDDIDVEIGGGKTRSADITTDIHAIRVGGTFKF